MLSIVVCVDKMGGFAKNGVIPWIENGKNKYPEDFKHFQEVTKGSTCVMGRHTYEEMVHLAQQNGRTIGESILPSRKCYVLTRDKKFHPLGATAAESLREVIDGVNTKVFVLGGEKIFIEALSWVDKIHMTIIKKDYKCDKRFPIDYVYKNFKIIDGRQTDDLYFVTYKRII